jgi:hypothetical protein
MLTFITDIFVFEEPAIPSVGKAARRLICCHS